jgi:hypothetical protein
MCVGVPRRRVTDAPVEDGLHVEDEARQDRVVGERGGIFQTLDRLVGTVDVNAAVLRIDQPAQPRSVGETGCPR